MDKIAELSIRMNRIKVLMDTSGMIMEELFADAAERNVQCEKCPLLKACDNHD